MVEASARNGARFLNELRRVAQDNESIKEVRGLGSFFAIEFTSEEATQHFVKNCREARLIIGWTLHHTTVVRAAPPLCMNDQEVEVALAILRAAA